MDAANNANFRTTRELFESTLEGEYDDDRPWAAVRALHKRDTPEVFEVASEFCHSPNPLKRARGLDVLAQLGCCNPSAERPYFDDCVQIAMRHLADEDPLPVHAAAWALAHLADDRAVAALVGMQTSADSGVRWAVVFGIAGSGHPEAISTLINLMEDDDEDVRNWATFGLGAQSVEDSPQIRDALRKRLADPFSEARDEAIWGLALRKDPIGIRMLLERLETDAWVQGDEVTATDILGLPSSADTTIEELCSGLRQTLAGFESREGHSSDSALP